MAGEIINIGNGKEYKIRDVINKILEIVGSLFDGLEHLSPVVGLYFVLGVHPDGKINSVSHILAILALVIDPTYPVGLMPLAF